MVSVTCAVPGFRFNHCKYQYTEYLLCLTQGIKQTDHFGFICRDQSESGPSQYCCFVFQCASESLVSPGKDENAFLFHSPCSSVLICRVSLCDCDVRWMRWCWLWSRPSPQPPPYRATKPRSSCVKPAPCTTCTSSVSGSKVRESHRHVSPPFARLNSWIHRCTARSASQSWSRMRDYSYFLLCVLGLYPPRAKLAIQKYLSQLTDNEQAEIFERVQVRFASVRGREKTSNMLPVVWWFVRNG